MSAWIIYALIWWMDNHLWEHEDVAGAKLIVYVWDLFTVCVCVCMWKVMLVNWYALLDVGCVAWTSVMDYSITVCSVYCMYFCIFICAIFRANHRSPCSDVLLRFSHANPSSHLPKTQGHIMHAHTNAPFSVWRCIHSPWNHLNVVHFILVQRPPLQLTLFPLQTPALTREMSGSPCRRFLASSNICEVLSSSLQLRRAVSQESRLLTRNTAKTARPSALKHIHSAGSFASTKDCISPRFVVFKASLSPCCRAPSVA